MDRRRFLFGLLSSKAAGRLLAAGNVNGKLPVFRDVTARSGVRFQCNASPTSQKYLIETMPGGVALFDYDGDGRLDLYFVNGAALGDPQPDGKPPDKSDPKYWNRLYHNDGGGVFTDVTEKAGVRGHSYGMGVATGDYDNDGRPDLYVTNFGRNILYHNNGDGTFTDVTEKAGVAGGGWSSSACFVDYDRDGWLDLIVTRYMDWDFSKNIFCGSREPGRRGYCHPASFKPVTHLAYHNNRDGTFTDVSKECGIGAVPGYGLGIAFNDYDRDGWPDILIANDNIPEQLFHNLRNGKFEEVALKLGLAYDEDGHTFSGMGADFADYDNDGWPDVFIGALANEKYALFRNHKGSFEYASDPSGVGSISATHSGWGLKFIDYDNDGWKDLFVAQGHVMDNIELTNPSLRYLEPMMLMHNQQGKFQDVSSVSGAPFQTRQAARGVAFGDFDNDGFIDIAVNCLNGPAMILHNEGGNGNHWLLVNTIGTVSNRDGIGAQIRLVSGSGLEQFGMVTTAGSYQSASDKRVHFGLGQDKIARLMEITWPSGIVQKLKDVAADRVITVEEPR
jgi:enediyne biosynthesis protein E4